VKYIKY